MCVCVCVPGSTVPGTGTGSTVTAYTDLHKVEPAERSKWGGAALEELLAAAGGGRLSFLQADPEKLPMNQ